eukprot:3730625-Pyramimonas_sp.AAC.1
MDALLRGLRASSAVLRECLRWASGCWTACCAARVAKVSCRPEGVAQVGIGLGDRRGIARSTQSVAVVGTACRSRG